MNKKNLEEKTNFFTKKRKHTAVMLLFFGTILEPTSGYAQRWTPLRYAHDVATHTTRRLHDGATGVARAAEDGATLARRAAVAYHGQLTDTRWKIEDLLTFFKRNIRDTYVSLKREGRDLYVSLKRELEDLL